MQAGYRLRSAQERDLAALPDIERRAAELFRDRDVSDEVLGDVTSPEVFAEACEAGLLFVAADAEDRPVGFALVESLGGELHLDELDVDPAHGRRGIGGALVERVCDEARERGHGALTLTTYADVPWNAPFYERHGSRVLGVGEQSEAMRALVAAEAEHGLDPARRVVMQRVLDPVRWWLRWGALGCLLVILALSSAVTNRTSLIRYHWLWNLPGRDKTGHFVLMGVFAAFAVLGFSRTRLAGRRIGAAEVLAGVALLVLIEEMMQRWLPRRNFSLEDLGYSLAGVALLGGLAALGQRWWHGRSRRRGAASGSQPPQR